MLRRRLLCTAAAQRVATDRFWQKLQATGLASTPQLASDLEAARSGTQDERAALAVALASRWTVQQVAATKQEKNVASVFALQVDGANVGLLRSSIWPAGPDGFTTAVLFGLHCDPALPLALASYPLIEHARKQLTDESIGAQRIMGIAALPGLCPWIAQEELWTRDGADFFVDGPVFSVDEQRAAVGAIARGVPLPGRDTLDEYTYAAAETAFKGMALE